jgi:hypothetical protein
MFVNLKNTKKKYFFLLDSFFRLVKPLKKMKKNEQLVMFVNINKRSNPETKKKCLKSKETNS